MTSTKRSRRTGLVAAAVLAVAVAVGVAPAHAPADLGPAGTLVSSAGPATEAPLSQLSGQGFLGELACYGCVGSALASTTYATAISRLVLSACLDICKVVM